MNRHSQFVTYYVTNTRRLARYDDVAGRVPAVQIIAVSRQGRPPDVVPFLGQKNPNSGRLPEACDLIFYRIYIIINFFYIF